MPAYPFLCIAREEGKGRESEGRNARSLFNNLSRDGDGGNEEVLGRSLVYSAMAKRALLRRHQLGLDAVNP